MRAPIWTLGRVSVTNFTEVVGVAVLLPSHLVGRTIRRCVLAFMQLAVSVAQCHRHQDRVGGIWKFRSMIQVRIRSTMAHDTWCSCVLAPGLWTTTKEPPNRRFVRVVLRGGRCAAA